MVSDPGSESLSERGETSWQKSTTMKLDRILAMLASAPKDVEATAAAKKTIEEETQATEAAERLAR